MQPLQQVCNAHAKSGAARGKKASAANKASAGSPSVTSVVFLDEYVLASAGATDGAVKLWDLRKAWNNQVSTPPLLPQTVSATVCAYRAYWCWRAGCGALERAGLVVLRLLKLGDAVKDP